MLPYVKTISDWLKRDEGAILSVWDTCVAEVRKESESVPEVAGTREFVRAALKLRDRLGVGEPVYLDAVMAKGGPPKYPDPAKSTPAPPPYAAESLIRRTMVMLRENGGRLP